MVCKTAHCSLLVPGASRLLHPFEYDQGAFLRTVGNRVEMLADNLVTKVLGVEHLEFIGNGRALHKVHTTADLKRIGKSRERLFHPFESAADDANSLSGSSVHGILRQECWSGLPLPSL